MSEDKETQKDDFIEWLREEFRKGFEAKLAEQPWWCVLCGAGGNYEGERPNEYWFPPEDHVCDLKPFNLKGLRPSLSIIDEVGGERTPDRPWRYEL